MVVSFEKWDEISDQTVLFYSVKLEENTLTEFEKFDDRPFPGRDQEIESIYNIIDELRYQGCKKWYFRFEGAADAIAVLSDEINEKCEDFGIRLYCIRCTENLLILLNGDIKTSQRAQDCPNVKLHFALANRIAKKLDEALANGEIDYENDNPFKDFELII